MKKSTFFTGLALVGGALALWYAIRNDLQVTEYEVDTDNEHPYTIAHLSDIHDCRPAGLIKALEDADPDYIFVTGDMVSDHTTDHSVSLGILAKCAEIAPTYCITGNHEWTMDDDARYEFFRQIEDTGAKLIDNMTTDLNEEIMLAGATEKADCFPRVPHWGYTILLSHHPEKIKAYKKSGYDLVLSGHAHGGQVRPYKTQGLYAPGQGIFPRYTAGKHGNLIISRGIGNDIVFPRVWNRPELVIIQLNPKKKATL